MIELGRWFELGGGTTGFTSLADLDRYLTRKAREIQKRAKPVMEEVGDVLVDAVKRRLAATSLKQRTKRMHQIRKKVTRDSRGDYGVRVGSPPDAFWVLFAEAGAKPHNVGKRGKSGGTHPGVRGHGFLTGAFYDKREAVAELVGTPLELR